MALLFFALDLRTLSPPLLGQLKQCLLELANLYAFSPPKYNSKRRKFDSLLEDRIGLCYLHRSGNSNGDELKIVYSPRGSSFNLRDFHYAVNHLPSDSYSPPFFEDSGSFVSSDLEISCIFNDEGLNSAGGKDAEKKIILISSCLVGNLNFDAKKILLDAAERCISVDFVFLEQKSSQLSDISNNINKFKGQICDLENCSFNAYLPDVQVFNGLAKRWLRELKENTEEILQAHFLFQGNIIGSVNRICCRLCDSINQIMDGFSPCKDSLMYHGINHEVGQDNADNNSTSVGEKGILSEASRRCWKNLSQVPFIINLNVIERTSLSSLSEGVVVGRPYFVIASVEEIDTVSEDSDLCHLNSRLFQGLCHALHSMNQGLICRSFYNLEIMRETVYMYYYILQPSDSGLMMLRRLAGAEEILPFPDENIDDSSTTEEIDSFIQQCLVEVELRDYNPVLHCGGFHQKLNQLVEESLQPGIIAPEISTALLNPICLDDVAVSVRPSLVKDVAAPSEGEVALPSGRETAAVTVQTCTSDQTDEDDRSISRLTQEWEQLIVGGIPSMDSALSKSNLEKGRTSPATSHRPLDTKTSIILERLGNPNQIKTKGTTQKILSGLATNTNGTMENHVYIDVDAAEQGLTASSNLMKPTFQRLKRKLR